MREVDAVADAELRCGLDADAAPPLAQLERVTDSHHARRFGLVHHPHGAHEVDKGGGAAGIDPPDAYLSDGKIRVEGKADEGGERIGSDE